MEKFLKYLMLMLVATFSLTFTSCGGDDDEPEGGTSASKFKVENFTEDKEFFRVPSFIDADGDEFYFCVIRTVYAYAYATESYNYVIGFDHKQYNYKCVARNIRMAQCKKVSSLSQITSLKGLDWIEYTIGSGGSSYPYTVNDDCLNLEENSGYILEGTYKGRTYYIRIYISSFNRNSAGEIIGVNGSYQQFVPN